MSDAKPIKMFSVAGEQMYIGCGEVNNGTLECSKC
jgi:hypothetical protein